MGARGFPNPLELLDTRVSRKGRLLVDGSPSFDFTNPSLAANAGWVINLVSNTPHGTAMAKYLPLDYIEVLNESNAELRLTLNDVSDFLVKARSTRVLRRKFWQVKIVNIGGVTAAAGEVDVTVELMPANADTLARRIAAAREA